VATVCTDEFYALGKAETECLGMPGLPIAIVPHPVAKLNPDGVAAMAAGIVDEVVRLWESDAESLRAEFRDKQPPVTRRLRYHSMFDGDFIGPQAPQRVRAPDDLEGVNRLFYARGWTDGLPIVPPTPERHASMLAEAGFDGAEVLGSIEPRQGRATVAKVAANAVMAGCQAEHLAVVVAATRAMCEPRLNLKALNTTTHPCTALALINGPIAEAIDVNATYNAMGQGSLANAVIGRAIRFVLLNIGGGTPGILDRSTMGSPAKYSFCFAENADDNPWGETLHMERGFDRGISTITLCGVEGPHNVNDHYGQTAEEVLLTVGGTIATTGANNSYLGGEVIVVLGPEHAEIVARDGFSKADVKDFLIEHAIIPASHISAPQRAATEAYVPERLLGPGHGVRIAAQRDDIMLLVAGGSGRHSCIIPSFGETRSVTVPITAGDGTPL
jgi:hypothetical protein